MLDEQQPAVIHLQQVISMFDQIGPQLGNAVGAFLTSQPDEKTVKELADWLAEVCEGVGEVQDLVAQWLRALVVGIGR